MPLLTRRDCLSFGSSPAAMAQSGNLYIDQDVFVLDAGDGTGNSHDPLVFTDYDLYLSQLSLHSQPIWACRLTGKQSLTYWEAAESESKATRSLETFPEIWKPSVLAMLQHSTESTETLAARAVEYSRTHHVAGEWVLVDLDSGVYGGRIVGVAPRKTGNAEVNVAMNPHSNANVVAYEYRVVLYEQGEQTGHEGSNEPSQEVFAKDSECGEAVFVVNVNEKPPFRRLPGVKGATLTKALVKRFIKSVATRATFPGSPWIVNDHTAAAYGLRTHLPPELAEKMARKNGSRIAFHDEKMLGTSPPSVPTIRDDMEVCEGRVLEPKGKILSEGIDHGDMGRALSIWSFCKTFSSVISISPFSPWHFIESLRHETSPNPILEAVYMGILGVVADVRRNIPKASYVECIQAANFQSYTPSIEPITEDNLQIVEHDESPKIIPDVAENPHDNDTAPISKSSSDEQLGIKEYEDLLQEICRIKWHDPPKNLGWTKQVMGFFGEAISLGLSKTLTDHSTAEVINELVKNNFSIQIGLYGLSVSSKLTILECLEGLALQSSTIRDYVDDTAEEAIEARKNRRIIDADRNKLVREIADLDRQLEGIRSEAENASEYERKALLKEIRSRETVLRKLRSEETLLEKKSHALEFQEQEFEKLRIEPIGYDRHYSAYWWLDDCHAKDEDANEDDVICGRLLVEENAQETGQIWKYFDDADSLRTLLTNLHPFGVRELTLSQSLSNMFEIISSYFPATQSKDQEEEVENPQEVENAAVSSEEDKSSPVPAPSRRGRKAKKRRRISNSGHGATAAIQGLFSSTKVDVPPFLRYTNHLKAGRK